MLADLLPLRAVRPWVLSPLLAMATAAVAAPPIPLRLIAINDFHGNLEAGTLNLSLPDPTEPGKFVRVPSGGAAALGGMVKALRADQPNSLMIAAGDLIGAAPLVSTLFRHESTIEVMNAIGLDASTVGNHEFDGGAAELKRIAAGGCAAAQPDAVASSCALGPTYGGAKFQYLSANVIDRPGHTLFPAYVIKRIGGVRVGIIGAVTKTTPSIVRPSGVAGLRFIDEADAVNRAARELKRQGVQAIVATFHEGGELGSPQHRGDWNDPSCPEGHGRIFEIAKRLSPDVGVILSGHTHQGYRCIVDGRVIIQATSYGRGISVVDVMLDPASGKFLPQLTRSINLPVMNGNTDAALRERFAAALPAPYGEILRSARPDAAVAEMVANVVAVVAPKADRLVGTISGAYTRRTVEDANANAPGGTADSAAGRLLADAQLDATSPPDRGGAQMALMNAGGIRADLDCRGTPPCPVTFGQVFTMQPFGNDLVVMTLTGAQIKSLLEQQRRGGASEMNTLQPSRGLTYAWHDAAPAGSRVTDLMLHGEPVLPERSYRVTVNNFMAEGGDGFLVLTQGAARTGGGPDLDALLDYLRAAPVRTPITQPRVTLAP